MSRSMLPSTPVPHPPALSRRAWLTWTASSMALLCVSAAPQASATTLSQRALFHMTPPRGWLCDGQRPIFFQGKTFFYYLHSDSNYGDGGWDMCTTTDLVHFTDNRVAIPLSTNFPVWTGSVVVDESDTAGFGPGTVIAVATQPTGGVRRQQEQYLYWSHDGYQFNRLEAPVIENPNGDSAQTPEEIDNAEWFRDPKIVWDSERGQWVCAIGRHRYLSIYTSPDLQHWTWTSNFDYVSPQVPDLGGMECPDIFRMTADDGSEHWVVAASMDAYAASLPMTYAYWICEWDGQRFTTDNLNPQWLDWGWDWYAAVTWPSHDEPETLRYAIAWMNNWKYAARDVPTDVTDGYNGQMSVVRELRLARQPGGWYSLLSSPLTALASAFTASEALPPVQVNGHALAPRSGRSYWLDFDVQWDEADNVGVSVGCNADNTRHVNIGVYDGHVYVDRGPANQEQYSFLPFRQAEAPIDPQARYVHLTVLVDRQSVEVFVNAGHTTLSQQVYFMEGDEGIRFYAHGGPATFSNIRWRCVR